ncbi:MAG: TraB/GumN family protein, partial [Sphingopyxis sp.]|nr:TraB/GumN family protein [Sphingopyxis sp.]
MKTWFKSLVSTCAIIPFAACALTPSPSAIAKEPAPAATTATVTTAKPAIWSVSDADTTIYLFGSVHVLKPGLSWFDGAVKQAFDKSDELILELVLPEDPAETAGIMMPLAIDQTGKTIPSRLTPDELKAYQAAMVSVGLPPAQFDAFEPWFAAVT